MRPLSVKDNQFREIISAMCPGGEFVGAEQLKGGYSSFVFKTCYKDADGQEQLCVIRIPHPEILEDMPDVIEREAAVLNILEVSDVPSPKLLYVDASLQTFSEPFLIMEWYDGEVVMQPENLDLFLEKYASLFSTIHKAVISKEQRIHLFDKGTYYQKKFSKKPEQIDESIFEDKIREVLESNWPLKNQNKPTLLHGDYWPANVMWKDNEIQGVIDWVDVAYGDPLEDLANARMELLWLFGEEAVEQFTQLYQQYMPHLDFANLPYWDLCAALRPAFKMRKWADEDDAREKEMRGYHRTFVKHAFKKLGLDSSIIA